MFDKGYIGITTRSWFEYIKENNFTEEVNFWRKNTNDFKVIKKGEPFFFLVKNFADIKSERKIEGFGLYEKYEVLTIAQAWDKYEKYNGVKDRRHFSSQMNELYDINREDEDTKIGCIILSDIKFFEKPISLSEMKISFANPIVSGKGITYQEAERILNAAEFPTDIDMEIENEQIGFSGDDDSFPEGTRKLKQHLVKERNAKLIKSAKENFQRSHNKLICEICDFDFEKRYGEIGKDFIEGHHTIPVSELKEGESTKVSDIVLVCSNCHSMLHRRRPWLKKDDLMKLINKN